MHFPGLNCSGSWVFHEGTGPHGLCALSLSQVQATEATGCLVMDCRRWAMHLTHLHSRSPLVSRVHHESTVPGAPYVSSEELASGCDALV